MILPSFAQNLIKEEVTIFASSFSLSLAEKADYAFFDGTFKAAPSGYTQLMIFIVLNKDTNIFTPIMYFFVSSKLEDVYEYLFLSMKLTFEKHDVKPSIQFINMDFEKGLQNSWAKVFPDIKIIGCYFHLVLKSNKIIH